MSWFRRIALVVLLLAVVTGGFVLQLRLVRPPCCDSPQSCCPPDHNAGCWEHEVEVDVARAADHDVVSDVPAVATDDVLVVGAVVSKDQVGAELTAHVIRQLVAMTRLPPYGLTRTMLLRP